MSNTANLSDILSNQTRPAATPPPSGGSASLSDIVTNQTQEAAKTPAIPTPPTKSTGQRIWDAIVHPETSGASSINLGSQGGDAPQPLPAANQPGTVLQGAEKGLTSMLGGVSGIVGGPKAEPQETQAKGPAEWTGDALESLAEFYAGDASFRALGVGEKLKTLGDVAKVLKDHPVLARLAATGATALRTGGVAGAQSLARGNSLDDAAKTAAIAGGTGAALDTVVPPIVAGAKKLISGGGADAASSLPAGSPTPYQRPNPFRKLVMSPKAVGAMEEAATSQPAAQTAVRTAVGAAPDAPILKDATTIVDQPIKDLYTRAKAAYKNVDDIAGFDVKAEKLALSNDQYSLKQLGNTDADNAARIKLNESIEDSTKRISDAETQLKTAGVDPKQADNINKAMKAGEQFKTLLVRNTNPDGTVRVDSLLNGAKVLRFNPKYGDRLAQFFGQGGDPGAGKAAADNFIADLQAAQKAGKAAGQKALDSRELRNMVLKYVVPSAGAALGAAAGYELVK
jgi:hypothetical protein